MTGKPSGELWSAAFGRSSLSPLIFTVKPASRAQVQRALDDLGVLTVTEEVDRGGSPAGHRSTRYKWSATQVLDGFMVGLVWRSPLPFEGELPSGMWVVGVRPLYLLIQLLGLRPPRRLSGVPRWDTSVDLLAEARSGVTDEKTETWTHSAVDITMPSALRELALNLFSPSCAVVLVDPGTQRASVARVLVNWTSASPSDAGAMIDSCPVTVVTGVHRTEALKLAQYLSLCGAKAELAPRG